MKFVIGIAIGVLVAISLNYQLPIVNPQPQIIHVEVVATPTIAPGVIVQPAYQAQFTPTIPPHVAAPTPAGDCANPNPPLFCMSAINE